MQRDMVIIGAGVVDAAAALATARAGMCVRELDRTLPLSFLEGKRGVYPNSSFSVLG